MSQLGGPAHGGDPSFERGLRLLAGGLIVAFVIFLVIRQVNRIKSKQTTDEGPTTKDCPFCLSTIPLKATRCKECAAELGAA